jgi:hypothetical protein
MAVISCDGSVEMIDGFPQCSGDWITVPDEALFVTTLFEIPDTETLQLLFATPFILILTVYLSAWALGQVVNFINDEPEN